MMIVVIIGLLGALFLVGFMTCKVSMEEYFHLLVNGILRLFLYLVGIGVAILLIYGGFLMIKSFFKWLAKNQEWFEQTEKRLKNLEERLTRQRSKVEELESDVERLSFEKLKAEKEIKKIKDYTGLLEVEKIERVKADLVNADSGDYSF